MPATPPFFSKERGLSRSDLPAERRKAVPYFERASPSSRAKRGDLPLPF